MALEARFQLHFEQESRCDARFPAEGGGAGGARGGPRPAVCGLHGCGGLSDLEAHLPHAAAHALGGLQKHLKGT